jgi:hypothetical protein
MPKTTTAPTVEVKPGQVWADNDKRATGRTFRVLRVYSDMKKAACVILTDRTPSPRMPVYRSMVGRTLRMKLSRFRPTANGYRLIQDAPDPEDVQ